MQRLFKIYESIISTKNIGHLIFISLVIAPQHRHE
ncbi:hypothetical protein OF001_U190042 [Pseudomonas sp. OF001]|nr:hypothetical protein OF001_U190042 [Pseudomonas sp. OF001]